MRSHVRANLFAELARRMRVSRSLHNARVLLGGGVTAVLIGIAACSAGNPNVPSGGDPVRMSESETDIAKDLWLRRNQPREALGHALDAVELDGNNAEAMHLAALLYLDLCRRSPDDCRLEEAERHARAAVEVKRDYREAINTLGVVLIHRKKYDDAIAVLKPLTGDILYQTPENAWGNLGWAYLEKGELDAAIDALSRAVAAQPMFCVGNYRLGLAHERQGQPAQALAALNRALSTEDPGCQSLQEAYFARARVHTKLGQLDDARDDLDQCIALKKSSQTGKDCLSMTRKLK